MTENAPPALAASSGDSSRGMPYYEKLRRDLRETLQKKRALDAQVVCPIYLRLLSLVETNAPRR
jgi:hypothetical protein